MCEQAHGEMVEEFWVGRRFAESAEIVRRRHDAIVEVMLPDAIGDRAPRECVARIDDPVGECEAKARALTVRGFDRWRWFKSRRDKRHSRLDHIAQ